jgi:hypothetical protein
MDNADAVDGETQDLAEGNTEVDHGEVPLTEATPEEIDAYLENATQAEESYESDDLISEPATEQQEQTQTTPEGNDSQEEETDPEAEKEELLARLQQQESFIQKRNSEVGELRKQIKEANRQLVDLYKQVHIEDPEKALAIQNQINANNLKDQALSEEAEGITRRHESQKILAHHVPQEDWDVVGMRESLLSDGLPAEAVDKFAADPIAFTRPDVLVQLAKRAKAEKNLKIVARYAKNLLKELEQARGAKTQVVKQIAANLKKAPSVSNGNGGSAMKTRSVDPSNLSRLSEKELDELLESSED